MSNSNPIPMDQKTIVIDGVATELVIQYYNDRIFVILTQIGRIGQLVRPALPLPSAYSQSALIDPSDDSSAQSTASADAFSPESPFPQLGSLRSFAFHDDANSLRRRSFDGNCVTA